MTACIGVRGDVRGRRPQNVGEVDPRQGESKSVKMTFDAIAVRKSYLSHSQVIVALEIRAWLRPGPAYLSQTNPRAPQSYMSIIFKGISAAARLSDWPAPLLCLP